MDISEEIDKILAVRPDPWTRVVLARLCRWLVLSLLGVLVFWLGLIVAYLLVPVWVLFVG
jgi:ABC-type transporter Mla maintaining outer membrane lipid asymmetry permease subunit MlaE